MTKKEHELMLMMFTRLYEMFGIIDETLKSRGLWTGDDPSAFSHAVHADDQKIRRYVQRARADYRACAGLLGMEIDAES